MIPLDQVDLTLAAQALAVANTPLFLIRKLKSDSAVRTISESYSDDEILIGIRATLASAEGGELVNVVRPYAYLVALWMKPRPTALRSASEFDAGGWTWYSTIPSYLSETYSPISRQTFIARPTGLVVSASKSEVPISTIVLKP
jgi:hypothetical protein